MSASGTLAVGNASPVNANSSNILKQCTVFVVHRAGGRPRATVPARDAGKRAGSTTTIRRLRQPSLSSKESFIHRHNRHIASHFFDRRQKLGVSAPAGFRNSVTVYDANRLSEKLRYAQSCDAGSAEAAAPPSSVTIASIASAASAASTAASTQTDIGTSSAPARPRGKDATGAVTAAASGDNDFSFGELHAADSPHRSKLMSSTSETHLHSAIPTMNLMLELATPRTMSSTSKSRWTCSSATDAVPSTFTSI